VLASRLRSAGSIGSRSVDSLAAPLRCRAALNFCNRSHRWVGRSGYSVAILALRIGFVDFVAMEAGLCRDMVGRSSVSFVDLVVMEEVVVCLARHSPASFADLAAMEAAVCLARCSPVSYFDSAAVGGVACQDSRFGSRC
jgi:hypothetical protein